MADHKTIQRDWKQLLAPLAAIAAVRAEKPEGLDQLDKALKKLPNGSVLGRAVDDLKAKTAAFVKASKQERRAEFRKIEAAFVNARRKSGTPLRELDHAWRIGSIELQVHREQARARALYNREQVVGWKPITSPDDLEALVAAANAELEKRSLPDKVLTEVCWRAYLTLAEQRAKDKKIDAARIPLLDLLREFRVALLRHELSTGKIDRKPKYVEFPMWSLLHNLDRYRKLGSKVPIEKRIAVETGSQRQTRSKGIILNGLDAKDEYKVFCYATAVKPSK